MSTEEGVGVGELSRQVRDVLNRFEVLAARLDSAYVRADNFSIYKQLVDNSLANLEKAVKELARAETVASLRHAVESKADQTTVKNLERSLNEKADQSEITEVRGRLSKLEDDKTWLIRLVGAFIILGVLGAIFVAQSSAGAGP